MTTGGSSTWVPTLVWVVLVLAYAALSSVWTAHDPGWYARLVKLAFQPPDLVFGLIWPLNFLALLAVGVWFTRTSEARGAWQATVVLGASVVAALAWAWLFYVPHRLGAATVALAIALALTWLLLGLITRSLPWAGALLVPYAVWLSVATALSAQYTRLN